MTNVWLIIETATGKAVACGIDDPPNIRLARGYEFKTNHPVVTELYTDRTYPGDYLEQEQMAGRAVRIVRPS